METNGVQFYLLRKQPLILVNGEQQSFGPAATKLLVYLADTSESEYVREELIQLVYGTERARETFRKKVVYPIRQLLPDMPLESGQNDLLHFNPDGIWVDSRIFSDQANDLLRANTIFHRKEYLAAKEILALYEAPFLAEYRPKSSAKMDDARFQAWQKSRQHDLSSLYFQLLDRVIAFDLKQQRHWAEAQYYAEQWLHSLNPSARPLQYLIWLAARQRTGSLNTYLADLHAREEAGELPLGPSWAEWNAWLKTGQTLALARLLPEMDSAPEVRTDSLVDQEIDRGSVLEPILKLLTTPRQEQVFAITGLPGVGKTEIARSAAQLLLERHAEYKLITLALAAPFDPELLCNAILKDLGRQDLFTLDYAKKRQRLKQLLQEPNLVIMVDEGYTTYLAEPETRNTVLGILSGARVMLIARDLPRFDHYVIELPGLDEEQTRSFLVSRVSWLREIEATKIKEIADLTRGVPLLLYIIAGGLKKELGRVHSLIEYLKAHNLSANASSDVYAVYAGVLAWLWQYLNTNDKDVLYAVSLFAPEEGADQEDLKLVLANTPSKEQLPQRINHLVDIHLIERKEQPSSRERYILGPMVLQFVRQQAQRLRRPHAPMIEQAYIRYLLDFIGTHVNQMERLDEHKQNVFRMFELVIFSDDHAWARPQAVDALNQIFPYFEIRGLYSTAARLVTRVLELGAFDSVEAHVQMLRRAARVALLRAEDEQSLKLYREALERARGAGVTQLYASLYHDIGNVQLETGRLEDAIRSFETAEQVVDAERRPHLLYSIWSNLGVTAFRQGRFELAVQYYQKVLDHLGGSETELPRELQTVAQFNLNALGLTATELGDYPTALSYFERSMVLAQILNYPQLMGYLYMNMGFTYCYQKEFDQAHHCFVQSGIIADQIQHVTLRTLVTFNQGMLASRRFLHQEALRLHRTALIEAEDHDVVWLKPQILVSLGKAYLRSEQFDSAAQSFSESLLTHAVTPIYVSQAIYGLCLSAMLKTYIIGNNNVETTLKRIAAPLASVPAEVLPLNLVSYLDWAHAAFERDLDHIPQLGRYRLVEALRTWLSDHPHA